MKTPKTQIEEMAKISCNTNNTEIKWECAECPFNTVCDIQNSCEALYNAGYRKQREGEWLFDDGMDRYCSNCGANALTNCFEYKQICTPYCPMCGAKMMFKAKGGAE